MVVCMKKIKGSIQDVNIYFEGHLVGYITTEDRGVLECGRENKAGLIIVVVQREDGTVDKTNFYL